MSAPIARELDLAARIAGGVLLGLLAGLLAAASCACGPTPSPACPVRTDDAETPAELAAGDACHRAGVRLAKLGCAEAREDWDAFCHEMLKQGVPLCPTKISRAKTCAEARAACR